MEAWIHLLARFTNEAIFFEGLAFCVLLMSYFAFWILKKRKYGSAGQVVPASLLRAYLNSLIGDAEQLRQQLFGLMRGTSGVHEPSLQLGSSATSLASLAAGAGLGSPALGAGGGAQLSSLEAKVAEQSRTIESLAQERTQLQNDLMAAKAASGGGGGDATASVGASGPSAEDVARTKGLQEKVDALEARLAEYAVIEDDLANLKRLQQENAKLKSALESSGQNVASIVGQAVPDPLPETPAAASEPVMAAVPDPIPSPAPAAEPSPLEAATADVPNFDGLSQQVGESLKEPPAGASVADTAAPLAAVNSPVLDAPATPLGDEKSDADLVAEFEKMLNG